jgi:hypothetical protein
VKHIPPDKGKQRQQLMTDTFKADPMTTYARMREVVASDKRFSRYTPPSDTAISAARKKAGFEPRSGPKPQRLVMRNSHSPMSRELSQERREYLLSVLIEKPSLNNATLKSHFEEKWPGLGGPSNNLMAECRKEAKHLRRAKPKHSVYEQVKEELKNGTVPQTFPHPVMECSVQLKKVLEEFEISGFSMTKDVGSATWNIQLPVTNYLKAKI